MIVNLIHRLIIHNSRFFIPEQRNISETAIARGKRIALSWHNTSVLTGECCREETTRLHSQCNLTKQTFNTKNEDRNNSLTSYLLSRCAANGFPSHRIIIDECSLTVTILSCSRDKCVFNTSPEKITIGVRSFYHKRIRLLISLKEKYKLTCKDRETCESL